MLFFTKYRHIRNEIFRPLSDITNSSKLVIQKLLINRLYSATQHTKDALVNTVLIVSFLKEFLLYFTFTGFLNQLLFNIHVHVTLFGAHLHYITTYDLKTTQFYPFLMSY